MGNYKILSIIAYDRSGTTFLGKLINQFENAFFMGEIDRGLAQFEKIKFKKCSCGSKIKDCDLWGKITLDSNFLKNKNKQILIYDRIVENIEAELLIDSSKSFSQIKYAGSINNREQFLIHLIRNPKGVIYSRMKNRKKRITDKSHPKPYIARHTNLLLIYDSFEWCLENLWMEKFKKKKKNVLTVFYEDLETEYEKKVIPFLLKAGLINREKKIPTSHILFGNQNRYNSNQLTIRIDNQWQEGLTIFQKRMVDIITFPVRKIYRYKF